MSLVPLPFQELARIQEPGITAMGRRTRPRKKRALSPLIALARFQERTALEPTHEEVTLVSRHAGSSYNKINASCSENRSNDIIDPIDVISLCLPFIALHEIDCETEER